MPDWRRLVARRLRGLRVKAERRDEIERELAGFLEDSYEGRVRGQRPRAAARESLAGVGGWRSLARGIEREEGEMGSRLRALWLPGLLVAIVALALSQLPHARWGGLSVVRLESRQTFIFVWTWMLMLPLLGALGAEWSRRQGGARREQLLVALAPVFALAIVYSLTFVLMGRPASQFPERGPMPGWLSMFVNLVLIPGLPALLGCLPSLRRSDVQTAGS